MKHCKLIINKTECYKLCQTSVDYLMMIGCHKLDTHPGDKVSCYNYALLVVDQHHFFPW